MTSISSLALDFEEWLEGWDRWALSRSVKAEQRTVTVDGLPVRVYEDGRSRGTPVMFVHSLDVFSSSFEMRRLFELFRHERPVAAIDLPGFGLSSREFAVYGAELLVTALATAVEDAAKRQRAPVHMVAARGSCHLAWATAAALPERVRSLTLISPTPSASTRTPFVPSFLRRAGAPVFRLLGTRAALKWYLKRSFAGEVDESFLEHAARAARVREAWRPAAAKLDVSLDALDRARGEALSMPAHLVHDGTALDPRWLGALGRLPAWEVTCMPSVEGMLHYEFACSTARAMRPFLADQDPKPVPRTQVPQPMRHA